ncbi:hypothetical protein ES1_13050 [[Eubacterium] siraeum V10Sc8a]|jgi:hypothetical protein|uniref:Uncharacterized protein n=1 Tax=[Eubacterium] siraeum V10Sc8a TaxID=717961 RepID=D4MKL4_9FIRM|nr:hypothetical protein [Oscillospiraceae bacterium]CBL34297.1 hypothetical protein ES1_13050 [[Eubacterium] siraeum V10Sc8a]
MLTFKSKITRGGNFKISPQILDILNAETGDEFIVSVNDGVSANPCCCENCEDCLNIPREYFEMAGISPDAKIEIYADNGLIEIREVEEDD